MPPTITGEHDHGNELSGHGKTSGIDGCRRSLPTAVERRPAAAGHHEVTGVTPRTWEGYSPSVR